MKHKTVDGGYLLVLQKGEELHKSLLSFCETTNIKSAWLSGLGGVTEATLGYYDLQEHQYKFRKLNNLVELVNLQGNLALLNNELLLHLHAVVGDTNLQTYGGHLKAALVGGTCEVFMQTWQVSLSRGYDAETGLNLLSL
jgi:predicted DNA-binding protein with PD1-like motif